MHKIAVSLLNHLLNYSKGALQPYQLLNMKEGTDCTVVFIKDQVWEIQSFRDTQGAF